MDSLDVASADNMEPQAGPSSSPSTVSGAEDVAGSGYVRRGLYSSERAEMYNLIKLTRQLDTREQCIAFAIEQGLLAAEKKCRFHNKPMSVTISNSNVGAFRCNKGKCRQISMISRGKGTWFENVKISLPHVFYLMYAYAHKWSYDMVQHEDIEIDNEKSLSRNTIADWYNYCRETVVTYQLDHQENVGKIGGPGKIVQNDESKFGKRKYNKVALQKLGFRVDLVPSDFIELCAIEMCGYEIFRCNIKSLEFNLAEPRDSVAQRAVAAVLEASVMMQRARNYMWSWTLIEGQIHKSAEYSPKNYWNLDADFEPLGRTCADCCHILLAGPPEQTGSEKNSDKYYHSQITLKNFASN